MNKHIQFPVGQYGESYEKHSVSVKGFVFIGLWFVITGLVAGMLVHFFGYPALG